MGKWIIAGAVALSLALAIALRLQSDAPRSSHKKSDVQHYFNVDEVVASPDFEHVLRVHGRVAKGSVVQRRTDGESTQLFVLEHGDDRLLVRHTGVLPDLFREGSECIATGELQRDGDGLVLDATDVVAKTPSF